MNTMSTATMVAWRSVSRPVVSCVRRYSSIPSHTSSPAKQTNNALPPEKMRALVSLYHQSESFITPEGLSEAIDYAFLYAPKERSAMGTEEDSFTALAVKLKVRRSLPKIGETSVGPQKDVSNKVQMVESWSNVRAKREWEAWRALYGVVGDTKPGLETLEEEGERIKEFLANDHSS